MILKGDKLEGADEIGVFLDVKPARIYQMFYSGQIPVFKMGRLITGRKSVLKNWIEEQENRNFYNKVN